MRSNSLAAMDFIGVGWDLFASLCVVPLKLFCMWNATLPRDDGEGHGESWDRRCSKRVASHYW